MGKNSHLAYNEATRMFMWQMPCKEQDHMEEKEKENKKYGRQVWHKLESHGLVYKNKSKSLRRSKC